MNFTFFGRGEPEATASAHAASNWLEFPIQNIQILRHFIPEALSSTRIKPSTPKLIINLEKKNLRPDEQISGSSPGCSYPDRPKVFSVLKV